MAQNVEDVTFNVTANTGQAEQALAKLRGEVDKTSESLGKKAKSTVNATGAIVSFGRIIQDAPFGIIGVGNNITMLSEQFVALKAQAGGTGAALKAMQAGIFGPLGLSLGISVVTSALTMMSMSAGKAKTEIGELKKTLDKLAEVRDPFKDMKFFIDPADLGMLIKSTEADLKAAKSKLGSMWLNKGGDDVVTNWVRAAFGGDPMAVFQKTPEILEMDKLRENISGLEQYLEVLKGWKVTSDQMQKTAGWLKSKGYSPESTKDTKDVKETVKSISEVYKDFENNIRETIKADKLLGQLTDLDNFSKWQIKLDEMLGKFKKGSDEYSGIIALKKELTGLYDITKSMTDFMKSEDLSGGKLPWESWGMKRYATTPIDPQKDWLFKGNIDPLDLSFMNERITDKTFGTKEYRQKFEEDVKQAKSQYKIYEDYFIKPFAETFRGEFSKAWNSIFGEATSLFEKFMQGVAEQLFNYGVQKAAFGLLNLIVPGAGEIGAAIGGGGGGGSRPIQVIVDGELMATQKMASRTKAIINRTASLK